MARDRRDIRLAWDRRDIRLTEIASRGCESLAERCAPSAK